MTMRVESIPLVVQPGNRDSLGLYDGNIINAIIEKQPDGKVMVLRRPGFVFKYKMTYASSFTGTMLTVGLFSYASSNPIGTKFNIVLLWSRDGGPSIEIFDMNPDTGYLTHLGTVSPLGGETFDPTVPWRFFVMSTSSPTIVMYNDHHIVGLNTGTLAVTDYTSSTPWGPTITTKILGHVCYLDDTVYAYCTDGNIYGSNINDLSTWSPTNFIKAWGDMDQPKFMVQQKSYILAMKDRSVEVLYDAANPTASPLGKAAALKITDIGVADTRSVVQVDDNIIMLGSTRSGMLCFIKIAGMKASIISTPAIDRIATYIWPIATDVKSYSVQCNGHRYYIYTVFAGSVSLVYDLTSDMWYSWTTASGTRLDYTLTNSYGLALSNLGVASRSHVSIAIDVDENVYEVINSNYDTADAAGTPVPYPLTIVTPVYDGGTQNKKYCSRIALQCDNNNTGTATVQVSDDDYESWSDPRTIDMNQPTCVLTKCGTFRRRAWKIIVNNTLNMRVSTLEAHLSVGSS